MIPRRRCRRHCFFVIFFVIIGLSLSLCHHCCPRFSHHCHFVIVIIVFVIIVVLSSLCHHFHFGISVDIVLSSLLSLLFYNLYCYCRFVIVSSVTLSLSSFFCFPLFCHHCCHCHLPSSAFCHHHGH